MQDTTAEIRVPTARAAKPAPAGDRSEAIRSAVLTAIVEHRLPAGTKLVEDELGAIFGVSRTVVRVALQGLAHDRLVVIERHRGASVARPTVAEARNVYAARRLLEPGIARTAAQGFTPADERRLADHLDREDHALSTNQRGLAIRLSGEFHLRVAEVAGKEILTRFLQELLSRASLVVAIYGRTGTSSCGTADHRALMAALRARDGDGAAAAMLHHLQHIEADLDFDPDAAPAVDLASILRTSLDAS